MRPGESSGKGGRLLKDTSGLIKNLASDGKLGKRDLRKIQSFVASSKSGFHYERPLLTGTLSGTLDASRYSAYVADKSGEIRAFRNQQGGLINQALQQSMGGLNTMLSAMSADARGALSGFSSVLNQSMARSAQSIGEQRAAFDSGNLLSEDMISQYQGQIASLPDQPGYTDQIGTSFEGVDAGSPFEGISQFQAPIQVRTAPALTGFNQAQQGSMARQMQGLSGFRSSRV